MAKRMGANRQMQRKRGKRKPHKVIKGFTRFIFRFLKFLCLSAAIGYMGFLAKDRLIPLFANHEIFSVKKISVYGNRQLSTEQIITFAGIDSTMTMIHIPIKEIKARIRMNSWVDEVVIKRRVPNTIRIGIKERKPIAIVMAKYPYFVDKKGYLWPLKVHTYWDLPVVSGLNDTCISETERYLKNDGMYRISEFLRKMGKNKNSLIKDISQIDFSRNEIVRVKLLSHSLTIVLNEKNFEGSLRNLHEILYRIENDTNSTVKHINLCFNNIAYIR